MKSAYFFSKPRYRCSARYVWSSVDRSPSLDAEGYLASISAHSIFSRSRIPRSLSICVDFMTSVRLNQYTTRLSLNYWLDFFGDEFVDKLSSVERQEAFHRWLLAKGTKSTTASRVLTAGRAAINRAWKRGEISSAPFIHPMPNARQAQQSAEPKGRALEVEEVARLLSASDVEHFRAFVLIMLATTGRPDAIRELTLAQCDVDTRLIALNPPGRTQTTKYRPTVRMPESIVPLITFLGKTLVGGIWLGKGTTW